MGRITMLSFFLTGLLTGVVFAKDSVDLAVYQWKNRLLLLFASSEEDPSYQNLKEQMERRRPDLTNRDLIVVRVLEKGQSHLGESPLTPDQSGFLRKQFSVSAGRFTTVLIGKDGGVKLREEGPIRLTDIFSLIDSMPMRRREMQKKPNGL